MQKVEIVKYDQQLDRYFAVGTNLLFSELGKLINYLKFYQQLLSKNQAAAINQIDDSTSLFLSSALCVKSEQLTTLKEQLSDIIKNLFRILKIQMVTAWHSSTLHYLDNVKKFEHVALGEKCPDI